MASTSFKRLWRAIAWAALGLIGGGFVAGIVIDAFTDSQDGQSPLGYAITFGGAVAGGIYGWKHDLSPRQPH